MNGIQNNILIELTLTIKKQLYRFSFTVHDGFKFFKVAQFNFQFLHLSLHKKRYKTLDLPLLNLRQMLSEKQP